MANENNKTAEDIIDVEGKVIDDVEAKDEGKEQEPEKKKKRTFPVHVDVDPKVKAVGVKALKVVGFTVAGAAAIGGAVWLKGNIDGKFYGQIIDGLTREVGRLKDQLAAMEVPKVEAAEVIETAAEAAEQVADAVVENAVEF